MSWITKTSTDIPYEIMVRLVGAENVAKPLPSYESPEEEIEALKQQITELKNQVALNSASNIMHIRTLTSYLALAKHVHKFPEICDVLDAPKLTKETAQENPNIERVTARIKLDEKQQELVTEAIIEYRRDQNNS